ncbi:MAG: hypothetical protein CMJ89_16910 [Planctomycetes bacterium]|jgi:sterol desaturase/sphingolipid hydroxylase (fatty acid hydroxylase superfamily)|nr:hypothetical protein [Planctomycetota bacterium]
MPTPMSYLQWLLLLSAIFLVAERILPARRDQGAARPQLVNDIGYLLFNGHYYAVVTGGITGGLALWTHSLFPAGALDSSLLSGIAPLWQFLIYLVVSDFLQWNVHVLLHRVPLLWQFHKIHHSAHRLDWAVNFRFHWMELVIYRSLLYLPLAFLGGDGEPLFAAAVFATAWGHYNHANIRIRLGPLGYIFNSPSMHLWHHDASTEGGVAKNYAIVLSLWDYLFRTAYWPPRDPERLGFPGDEEVPPDILRQELFPVRFKRS